MCAGKEQSLLFDLLNAFDQIESNYKSEFFLFKELPIFPYACATSTDLPSNIRKNGQSYGTCVLAAIYEHIVVSPHGTYI